MMGVTIGNNNVLQGNVNIGENAKQIAKNFNQEFNSVDKILDLIKSELQSNYKEVDKDTIIKEFDELKGEMTKSNEERDNGKIKQHMLKLGPALSVIADVSGVASMIYTIVQAFK